MRSSNDRVTVGRWVLIAAIIGSSMTFIDGTAVNVALPSIQRDLHASGVDLQWTVEGYALLLSACILIGGSLGDLYGRKRVFCIGIAGFALASLACSLAQNMLVLNIARAVQGVSAALATPGSLALISANFDAQERGRAIGTWSGFAAMTGAIGPLLGGWLADHASWRAVFIINIPLAIIVLAIALLRVPESTERDASPHIDIPGSLLACLSLGGFTYALLGFQSGKHATMNLFVISVSMLLFAGFLFWESRAPYPMMPLRHFRNASFSILNLYTFFLYAALGGSLFFVPFNLQNVQGYSASAAGAAMLPFIVILFVSSRWSGGLVSKIGIRLPLVLGAALAACGFFLYSIIGVGGSYWTTFFPAACMLGFGGSFFVAPLTTSVMSSLDIAFAGIASGINNAVSRIAGLLAIAALGLLLSTSFYARFDRDIAALHLGARSQRILLDQREALVSGRLPQQLLAKDQAPLQTAIMGAYVAGFRNVMLCSTALSATAGLIALFALRGNRP